VRRALRWIGLVVAVVAVAAAVRTATFKSRQGPAEPAPELSVAPEQLAAHLAGALRFRTVSNQDPAQTDAEAFSGLHRYLEQTFPRVHAAFGREIVGGQSLLYTWKGSDPALKPLLLLAHQDVVPVEPGTEGQWTEPPFEGRIADGFIWGRGAWDDKAAVVSLLDAAELLLADGYKPRRTVLLAFGHDEEIGGTAGAAQIAALLKDRHVEPEFVLDEGMAITRGMVPGIAGPVALIGTAEKGYVSVELSVQAEGGHSSMPPRSTAIGILAQAIHALEQHPMPGGIAGVAAETFEFLGPEMALPQRALFANLWLFGPLVEHVLAGSPGTDALLRTTTAATMIEGGVKENVLPSRARAVVNFRIRPGDSIEAVLEHVRSTVADPRVAVARAGDVGGEPSPASDPEAPAFALVQRTVRQVMPEAVVAPSLVLGATDARHYTGLTPNVYRFVPVLVGREDLPRFHGTNERISLQDYVRCVRFYRQLIRNADTL
jgi:carboxypeptidase PM20D1